MGRSWSFIRGYRRRRILHRDKHSIKSKFGLDPFDWTTYLFQGDAWDKLTKLFTKTR